MQATLVKAKFALGRTMLVTVRHLLVQTRRELSHQQLVRRLGEDPTRAIGSTSDAVDTARTLLDPVSRQDTDDHHMWVNVAVGPLAELLYAASQQRGAGNGMQWTWHALVNVEAPTAVPGWQRAARIWDQADTALPGQLLRIAQLPARQRQSVIHTMHAAIAPWLSGRNER
ncbi:type IV secretory pathway, VirD4 component [Mycobacteroides abscessus subsp. massiliense]|uniref:hypothetical protein n=1 Tax=Mycobacteroides abscessus TaxID=36809 RepID=UPI0009A5C252|nr:hypothetical protein [Mycobacteroides abscessus]SKK91877.1 type IV secretory pathway, VirD4 component [Mycobacteroides abscessus subsp. massiliense]